MTFDPKNYNRSSRENESVSLTVDCTKFDIVAGGNVEFDGEIKVSSQKSNYSQTISFANSNENTIKPHSELEDLIAAELNIQGSDYVGNLAKIGQLANPGGIYEIHATRHYKPEDELHSFVEQNVTVNIIKIPEYEY